MKLLGIIVLIAVAVVAPAPIGGVAAGQDTYRVLLEPDGEPIYGAIADPDAPVIVLRREDGRSQSFRRDRVYEMEVETPSEREARRRTMEEAQRRNLEDRGYVDLDGRQVPRVELELARRAFEMSAAADTPPADGNRGPNTDVQDRNGSPGAPWFQFGPHALTVAAALGLIVIVLKTMVLK